MEQKQTPKHQHFAWFHRHRTRYIAIFAVIIVVIAAAGAWYILYAQHKPVSMDIPKPKVAPKPTPPAKIYSPLTGMEVPDLATTKREVTAIMIENSPDARPQSGIKDAGIVYEAIAEGGITRFVCLYQEARPGLIGPVRSVRPYYIEWTASYNPAYAHVGGSRRALETVRNGEYKDLDQFFNANAYYRSDDRYAPHNVYTTFDRLDALNKSKGFNESSFTGLPRKDDRPIATPNASSINVDISGELYNSAYTYDKPSNSYARQQDGAPHLDREAGQIAPKVVAVIKVPIAIGEEDGYREQIDTNGSGPADIFQDGTVTEGKWVKDGAKGQLSFTDSAGKPLALNRGQLWVTAIGTDHDVTWK